MPNLDPLEKLQRTLRCQGMPGGYVSRTLRELSDHREDLRAEAAGQGLTGDAAERFVAAKLGRLDDLAVKLPRTMRQSNWYGRHPVLSFCVLPVLAFLIAFLVAIWIVFSAGEVSGWWRPRLLDTDDWSGIIVAIQLFRWGLFTAIPFWFCWLSRSSYCGHKWALMTCLVFSLHGTVHSMKVVSPLEGKGALSWGYGLQIDLAGMLIPLGVFALFWILSRHADARETSMERSRTCESSPC